MSESTKKVAVIVLVVAALAIAAWSGLRSFGVGQGRVVGYLGGSGRAAEKANSTTGSAGQPGNSPSGAPPELQQLDRGRG